jgi:hypothetical protein
MRMMTILAFALCCHVVYAGDLHSMLSTYLHTAGVAPHRSWRPLAAFKKPLTR